MDGESKKRAKRMALPPNHLKQTIVNKLYDFEYFSLSHYKKAEQLIQALDEAGYKIVFKD